MAVDKIYYVYEHWRLDKDECFYVGKGKGRRAYEKSCRGNHWKSVVKYLNKIGSAYEIRMVKTGITEKEAFSLEIERISFWKSIGVNLTNKTNGGDGTSGMKHSEQAKAKMSADRIGNQYAKGMTHSDEFKETQRINFIFNNPMKNPDIAKKTSESLKALGDKHPARQEETRRKNSASRKGKCVGKDNGFYGKKHSAEIIEIISKKNMGRFAGSKHHNSKLNEEQVVEILKSKDKQDTLADRYGVSRGLITAIKNRRAWRHVRVEEITQ